MGGGIRLDPLSTPGLESDKMATRISASYLRGFRLLPQGVFPVGKMRKSATQIIDVSSETKVLFDVRDHDTPYDDGQQQSGTEMCDLTNNELVIRVDGFYDGHFFGVLEGSGGGIRRLARVFLNNSTVIGIGGGVIGPAADGTILYVPFAGFYVAGDTIEAKIFHDSSIPSGGLDLFALHDGPRLVATWRSL